MFVILSLFCRYFVSRPRNIWYCVSVCARKTCTNGPWRTRRPLAWSSQGLWSWDTYHQHSKRYELWIMSNIENPTINHREIDVASVLVSFVLSLTRQLASTSCVPTQMVDSTTQWFSTILNILIRLVIVFLTSNTSEWYRTVCRHGRERDLCSSLKPRLSTTKLVRARTSSNIPLPVNTGTVTAFVPIGGIPLPLRLTVNSSRP